MSARLGLVGGGGLLATPDASERAGRPVAPGLVLEMRTVFGDQVWGGVPGRCHEGSVRP